MRADRDNIATFVAVVRRESLAGAARQLGVPRSTVSRRLARLEEQLDLRLLHRDARRITLTGPGRELFDAVVAPVDALDQAVQDLERSSSQPSGTVRITAPSDLGRLILVEPLVAFMQACPLVSVELMLTNRVVDLIQEGVDIAVRAGGVEDSDLIARPLFVSEFHLVAPADASPPDCELADLKTHDFVLHNRRSDGQNIRLVHQDDGTEVELLVNGRVSVTDYETMIEFVAAGQGLGLMPSIHAALGVRRGQVKRIFAQYALPAQDIQLVYTTRRLPERVRRAIDFLHGALKQG